MQAHLNPAVRTFWRDRHTVQIGARTERAVVLTGIGPQHHDVLRGLGIAPPNGGDVWAPVAGPRVEATSTSDVAGPRVEATSTSGACTDVDTEDSIVEHLLTAGLLVTAEPTVLGDARLHPDRASVGLVHGDADGGASRMTRRAERTVTVLGAGRIGAAVARLLAAAGVGRVEVEDDASTTAADLTPGGLDENDLGMPRGRAVERHVERLTRIRHMRRAAPVGRSRSARVGRGGADVPPEGVDEVEADARRADLVVVAPGSGHRHGRTEATRLVREGVAHLLLEIVETVGVVGPLVIPGETSCLRCHDLHRTDRDPGWPRLLTVLDQSSHGGLAGEVTLAATVAALGANQALSHLDGQATQLRDATWELSVADPFPRRRSWRAHPACGCQWAG